MTAFTQKEVDSFCVEPSNETKDYFIHELALVTKDPKKSLRFYTEVLGMRYCPSFL